MPRSTLADPVRRLLEGRNFCHVATLNENGSIHATLVWIGVEDDVIVLNSARHRRWPTNAEDQYEYVWIQAVLAQVTEKDGLDVINALSQKYEGRPYPPLKPGEVRVTLRLAPERVVHRGG